MFQLLLADYLNCYFEMTFFLHEHTRNLSNLLPKIHLKVLMEEVTRTLLCIRM